MKSLIIIPTYNEKKNIGLLAEEIVKLKIDGLDILVVDDNSPDGTACAVEELRKQHRNIFLIKRPGKMGLGAAYIAGFKYALENRYDFAVEMDADFSHDPKYLPKMLALANEADFVIGSRYVKEGGVENWNWRRRLVSRFGSLYSSAILSLDIHDLTGGSMLGAARH
jgi:dolichol-phosphate mannosyltransferase